MQHSYFYTYLIGDGRYHRTSYALTGKKALYRFIREEHGIDKVYGVVKVIRRTAEPIYAVVRTPRQILVKKEVF